MTAALMALVLALISQAWAAWGVSRPPQIIVTFLGGSPTQSIWAADSVGAVDGVCGLYLYQPFADEYQFEQTDAYLHPMRPPSAAAWPPQALLLEVVEHEMGHCLGLSHSPRPGDLMYFSPNPFLSGPTLNDLYRYHQTFAYRVFVPGLSH